MAISVNFYTFAKKANSTQRPSGGTAFSCNLKTSSSVVNPRIELNYSGNPSQWNYAYIPNYSRYYYITNWTYEPPLWVADLDTDVMASYKSEIGSTSLYVLRASADFDGDIIDTMYPCKLPYTTTRTVNTIPGWDTTGSYVVGITGTSAPQMGSVTYFALSAAELTSIIQWLYGVGFDDVTNQLDSDVQAERVAVQDDFLFNALAQVKVAQYQARYNYNPIQYFVSCMWFPLQVPRGASQQVRIGSWNTGLSLNRLGAAGYMNDADQALPRHPLAATRGDYLNAAPFTSYTVNTTVWGDFDLDATVLAKATGIRHVYGIDYITGEGLLYTFAINGSNVGPVLASNSAQIGVPIQLTEKLIDTVGSGNTKLQAYLSMASSAVGSLSSGNGGDLLSGVTGLLKGIESADKLRVPRVSINGSNGNRMADVEADFTLYSTFASLPPEDNATRGRPLMQVRTPASLGGYMLISDGDVPIPGTTGEQERIREILEEGFYYE